MYKTRGKHRDFSIAGRIYIIGCIKCLKSEDEQSWADDGREAKKIKGDGQSAILLGWTLKNSKIIYQNIDNSDIIMQEIEKKTKIIYWKMDNL